MWILSKNTIIETSRIMFDQTSWHHGPANLTHKINHHTPYVIHEEALDFKKMYTSLQFIICNSKFKKTENSFFLSYLLRFCGKIWHEMIGYFWYMYFYICTHIYRYTETFISFVMPINMFYWKIFMIVIISVILLTHKILFLNPWILLYCMGNLWTPTNHSQ